MFYNYIRHDKVVSLDEPIVSFKMHGGSNPKMSVDDIRNNKKTDEINGMDVQDLFNANEDRLNRLVDVSKSSAEYELSHHNGEALISFSGGKDSTLLADLLKEFRLKKLFVDLGVEFPETYDYFNLFSDLDMVQADQDFITMCRSKGLPTLKNRWCTKEVKFDALRRYFSQFDDDVLVFNGERKFESVSRMDQPFKRMNRYIPNQISIQPILDWLSLDVWIYTLINKLPVNDLYKYFDRVGCWACPFYGSGRQFFMQYTHPKLYEKLKELKGLRLMKQTNLIRR